MIHDSFSVIFPAFNESKNIEAAISTAEDFFKKNEVTDYEVIVVNDGSSDNTAEIAEACGATVVENYHNMGKGYSVRRGVNAASKEFVLFSDVDLSTPFSTLGKFDTVANGYDVVIASRNMGDSDVHGRGGLRNFLGSGFAWLVSFACLPGIRDSQCGFKLFRRQCATDVFSQVSLDGWAFDVEVLAIALALGYRVKELPVVWIEDADSRLSLSTIPRMLADLFFVRGVIARMRKQKETEKK